MPLSLQKGIGRDLLQWGGSKEIVCEGGIQAHY